MFVRLEAFARVHIIYFFLAFYPGEMLYINDASKEYIFESRSGEKVVWEGLWGADFYGLW
jgi:hypothetical protein